MAIGDKTYTRELADEICERISHGETLRAICREKGKPSWQRVYEWIDADIDGFAGRIERARVKGYDAIAEETVSILDEPPERINTEHGDKVDPGYVQWQKNRAEQRLKLLAKWHPKKYGDKQEVDLNVKGELGIAERLQQGRKRAGK